MLNQLSWPTLQTRRKLSRRQTLHKVFTNRYHLKFLHTTYEHHDPRDSTIHCTTSYHMYVPHHTKIVIFQEQLMIGTPEVADADIFRTGLQSLL